MSYFIAAISNGGGAPEQAYRRMQAAGACPEKPFAGKFFLIKKMSFPNFGKGEDEFPPTRDREGKMAKFIS
jgi:hypothetical protein